MTKRNPHHISPTQWWYEDKRGICVIVEARNQDGTYHSTTHTNISWNKLLKAAKRCVKSKERK